MKKIIMAFCLCAISAFGCETINEKTRIEDSISTSSAFNESRMFMRTCPTVKF